MVFRGVTAFAGVVLLSCLVSGCVAHDPDPTPTPLFATEEEAFAAAEETYRAYLDVVNAQRDGDMNADPRRFLSGRALQNEIDSHSRLQELGLSVSGTTVLSAFIGSKFETGPVRPSITAELCIDSTNTRVMDEHGHDVTPSTREEVTDLEVEFGAYADGLHITASRTGGMACTSRP